MDIDWKGGALGVLVTGLIALVTDRGLANRKRQKSADDLAETQNTIGGNYIESLDRQYEKAIRQRDEAVQQAQVNLDMYLTEKRRVSERDIQIMEHEYQIRRMKEQLDALGQVVMRKHPDEGAGLEESGFAPLEFR